ncbi:MAG: thioredoxin-disulfide reductase [Acidimicrobiia bacterium]
MSPQDVVIVGSGPAGLTAALYAARADLSPVVFEGAASGGQLMLTTEVENFPGFPEGVMGPELMERFREQAQRFGADLRALDVESIDLSSRPFTLVAGGDEIRAHAVILATGATARWLGLENEPRLAGRGVSTCATCDGFFFRDKPIAVVGGGDSAIEEALFLTRFGTKVTVVHRRDELRASKIMAARARDNSKIDFVWNSVVVDLVGDDKLEAAILEDVVTGERSRLDVEGLFVAIGHTPTTDIVKGQVQLDDAGYVVTHGGTRTSVRGVWAAGDVQDREWRQAVTAAGSGCAAAIDAERYLEAEAFSGADSLDW